MNSCVAKRMLRQIHMHENLLAGSIADGTHQQRQGKLSEGQGSGGGEEKIEKKKGMGGREGKESCPQWQAGKKSDGKQPEVSIFLRHPLQAPGGSHKILSLQ